MSLSLLLGDVVQNGPERSRARRCWARRSGPLTARTVLRDWSTRERLGEELAKNGAKKWPLRPAPLTVIRDNNGMALSLEPVATPVIPGLRVSYKLSMGKQQPQI